MRIRPLTTADVEEAYAVMKTAFDGLRERLGNPPESWPPVATGRLRFDHFIGTDPDGAWAAVDDAGNVVGCAVALMREGVWGLSLLVVRPDAQSSGVGRQLLEQSWAYGQDTRRGAIILSSPDPRALRAYARLGLSLQPAMTAKGRVKSVVAPLEVRAGGPGDWEFVASVDRKVRGAGRAPDMKALTTPPNEFLVLPEGGYVIVREGNVRLLAATDDGRAAVLLRAALAASDDREVSVEWITADQNWAVTPCLDAGLALTLNAGAVFVGGDVGPFTPYLPNGAYL